jgi:creatinine amidohydrolase
MLKDSYWINQTDATFPLLCEASERVAMIPLGSIESHGPHLPLGCDPIKTDNLVKEILKLETVATLPTLAYSYVADARMMPGAIHIKSHILMDYVECICDEVYRNGFNKIILLHGHGGNTSLHTMFCNRMLEKEKPYAVFSLSAQGDKWDVMMEMTEGKHNGHACEWETSIFSMARPELVRMELLGDKEFPKHERPDVGNALTAIDWVVKYPEMAVGKPQLATKEKGAKFLQIASTSVAEHIRKIKKDTKTLETIASYIKRANSVGGRD